MKYAKKTLEEIRKVLGQVEELGRQATSKTVYDRVAEQEQNGPTQDHKNAARSLRIDISNMMGVASRAKTLSAAIQKIIDGTDPYPEQTLREMEDFIGKVQNKGKSLAEDVQEYFIWNNHDHTPAYSDPAWPIYNVATQFHELGKNLGSLQQANGIHGYRETEARLKEEMKYLSAMSCDGLKLEEVSEKLGKAQKGLSDAQDTLNYLKSPAGMQEWKEKYANAILRVRQIPEQIKKYEDQLDNMDEEIEDQRSALKSVKDAHQEYLETRDELEQTRAQLNTASVEVNRMQDQNTREHRDAERYERDKKAYAGRAGSGAGLFESYLNARDRDLRWSKIRELADQLKKAVENDDIAQTILFARVEKKAKSFLGVEYQERRAGTPLWYLKQLEQQIRQAPARDQRLNEGRAIADQMLELAPDKAKMQELLVRIAGEPEQEYFQKLMEGIDEQIRTAQQEMADNAAYQQTQKQKRELEQVKGSLEKNQEELKRTDLSVDEREVREKNVVELTEEVVRLSKEFAANAINTDEVDRLIGDHITSAEKLAKSDGKLYDKKEQQEYLEEKAQRLGQKLGDLRKKTVEKYSATYEIVKKGEGNAAGNNASDQVLGQLAGDNAEKEDAVFDQVEKELQSKLDANVENRNNVIPKTLNDLRKELDQQKQNLKDYSFEAYKNALTDAHVDVEERRREVSRLSAIDRHLSTAKNLHNERAGHINSALGALDHERQQILQGIEDFKKNFDKNKKTNHGNSDEYKAIKNVLDRFTEESVKTMTPEQLKQNLSDLKDAASQYKTKKNGQWFHWRPSAQRRFRLSQADNIERFADAHTTTIDGMGLDAETTQALKDAAEGKYTEIQDGKAFAQEADRIKGNYRDGAVDSFSSLVWEVKNSYQADLKPEWGEMSEKGKREVIRDALVSNEVEQKLWDFDPAKENLDKHNLDLKQIKTQAAANVENDNKALIDQAVADSRNKNLTGGNISWRKQKQEAGRVYRGITGYDQQVQNVIDRNLNNAVNNNKPIMPGGLY